MPVHGLPVVPPARRLASHRPCSARRPDNALVVQHERQRLVVRCAQVGADQLIGELAVSAELQIHCEEADVTRDVAEPNAIVEFDAVHHARSSRPRGSRWRPLAGRRGSRARSRDPPDRPSSPRSCAGTLRRTGAVRRAPPAPPDGRHTVRSARSSHPSCVERHRRVRTLAMPASVNESRWNAAIVRATARMSSDVTPAWRSSAGIMRPSGMRRILTA